MAVIVTVSLKGLNVCRTHCHPADSYLSGVAGVAEITVRLRSIAAGKLLAEIWIQFVNWCC